MAGWCTNSTTDGQQGAIVGETTGGHSWGDNRGHSWGDNRGAIVGETTAFEEPADQGEFV